MQMQNLCYNAKVDLMSKNGGSIEDVDQFQKYYGDEYQIIVYVCDQESREYTKLYSGPSGEKKLFLRYEDNHYDVIETITAFLGSDGYCYHCLTPYEKRRFHKCKYLCSHCEEYHVDINNSNEKGIKCLYCHRTFPNQVC